MSGWSDTPSAPSSRAATPQPIGTQTTTFTDLPVECVEMVYDNLAEDEEGLADLVALSQTAVYPSVCARPYVYTVMGWKFIEGEGDGRWNVYLRSPQRQLTEYILLESDIRSRFVYTEFLRVQQRGGVPNTLTGTVAPQGNRIIVRVWKETEGLELFGRLPLAVSRACRHFLDRGEWEDGGVEIDLITEDIQEQTRPLLLDSPGERLPSVKAVADHLLRSYRLQPPRSIAGNASPSRASSPEEAEAVPTTPPSQPLDATHTPSSSPLFGSFVSSARSPSPFPFDILPAYPRIQRAIPSAPGTPTARRADPGPDLPCLASSRSATLSVRMEADLRGRPGEHLLSSGTIRHINLRPAVPGSPLPVSVLLDCARALSIRNRDAPKDSEDAWLFRNCVLDVGEFSTWSSRRHLGEAILSLCECKKECINVDLRFHLRCAPFEKIPSEQDILAFIDIFFFHYIVVACQTFPSDSVSPVRSISWPKVEIGHLSSPPTRPHSPASLSLPGLEEDGSGF